LMVGFAGSVEIGFAMVHDLQKALDLEQPVDFPARQRMHLPQVACWHWHRRGRRIFSCFPGTLQQLGCHLLVVGTSPFSNGGLGLISRCIRMRAPGFFPERVVNGWSSIGTGAQTESARHYAQSFLSQGGSALLQGEVMHRGGAA